MFWGVQGQESMPSESPNPDQFVVTAPSLPPISPELAASLGPPPLYRGESAAEYEHMYASLRSAIAPLDVIEEIFIRDVADYFWDVRRLRRLKAKLLESSRASGLWRLLNHQVPNLQERAKLVSRWALGEPAAIDRVTTLIRNAGLEDSAIEAQTLAATIPYIEQIDRLITKADERFAALLREIDRHRTAVAVRVREAAQTVVDAEFEEVEPGSQG